MGRAREGAWLGLGRSHTEERGHEEIRRYVMGRDHTEGRGYVGAESQRGWGYLRGRGHI